MSVAQSFTQEQIQFIFNELFGTLKNDFNYDLGSSKRKAAMTKAFKARNFDALLQKLPKTDSQLPQDDAVTIGFRWYQQVIADGEIKHVSIGDPMKDEIVLSDLIFDTEDDAIEAIRENLWGYDEDYLSEINNVVLARVTHNCVDHPFSRDSEELAEEDFAPNTIFSGCKPFKNSDDIKSVIDKSKIMDTFTSAKIAEVNIIDKDFTDLHITYPENDVREEVTLELHVHLDEEKSEEGTVRIYLSDEHGPKIDEEIEIQDAHLKSSWSKPFNNKYGKAILKSLMAAKTKDTQEPLTVEHLYNDYIRVHKEIFAPIIAVPYRP